MEEQVIDTDGQTITKITNSYGGVEYRNTKDKLHRIGGPARTWPDGYQEYWVNGKQHRLDGPAYINQDGIHEYWVDDIYYIEEQYPQAVLEYKLKQLVG